MNVRELIDMLDGWGDHMPVKVGKEPYGDTMDEPGPLEVTDETLDGESTVVIRPVV